MKGLDEVDDVTDGLFVEGLEDESGDGEVVIHGSLIAFGVAAHADHGREGLAETLHVGNREVQKVDPCPIRQLTVQQNHIVQQLVLQKAGSGL